MKIRQIKEAVDWEKSMDGNDNNLDRIKRLKNLQVDIPPVMGDALEDDEKFDKNSKEVFTKLSKDAESVTPKNPGTGKKITRKPYTEKLILDEKLFKEAWTSFGGSWRNQTVKKVNYTEEDISDIAEELMNWYGECFDGWEAADIKSALYGLDGERIPDCDCPIIFTMEEDEDEDDEEYDESFKRHNKMVESKSRRGRKSLTESSNGKKKYIVTNIDYAIEEEDVEDYLDNDDLDEDELEKEIQKKIEEIRKSLPKKLIIKVSDEDDIADEISDRTGWLVNDFDYKEVKEESVSKKGRKLKESSEYKTLAKLSKGLEVISYPYGYAISDGYVNDRFVVRGDSFVVDDGRFRLSDKDKAKINNLIKKGIIKSRSDECVNESYGDTKFEARSYYGRNFSGLEDSLETDDYSELEDWVWEKIGSGVSIEVQNSETGERVRLDSDDYDFESDDSYRVLDDLKAVLEENLSLKEDYYHFEYKSGANPYIAKTEKERDRILRKYKNKVTKKDDKSFVIDDIEKDSFAIEEDYDRPIATMGLTNTSGIGIYNLNDEEVTYAFIDGGDKEPVKQTATVEYDCEDEKDCRPYFSVGDTKYFLDDFMKITESKSSNLKKKSLEEAKDPDEAEEEETVLDFVDSRLFGTNKRGSKPSSSNYRKVYNFLDDVQIPLKGGKGFSGAFFYPDSNSSYFVDAEGSGTTGKLGRRYPMMDDGIGVYLVDKDEEVLAKAVANELGFNYKLSPISSNKGFKYVAKIFIPESIMEMPIKEYLDSIGKSLNSYKKGTGKRGRKARNQE